MPERPAAYVASPYGFAESTTYWYSRVLLPALRAHVDVLDPWSVEEPAGIRDPRERWLALGEKHLRTVEDADLLVACLDQEPPDAGTLVELAWAASRGTPVIAYRNDVRQSGEEGLRYNLMIGAAVRRSGGVEVGTVAALTDAVAAYAQRWYVT